MISSVFRYAWHVMMRCSDLLYWSGLWFVLGICAFLLLGHFINLEPFMFGLKVFSTVVIFLFFVGLCRSVARIREERLARDDQEEGDYDGRI